MMLAKFANVFRNVHVLLQVDDGTVQVCIANAESSKAVPEKPTKSATVTSASAHRPAAVSTSKVAASPVKVVSKVVESEEETDDESDETDGSEDEYDEVSFRSL